MGKSTPFKRGGGQGQVEGGGGGGQGPTVRRRSNEIITMAADGVGGRRGPHAAQ